MRDTVKFLIVDDDADDREMFCEALKNTAPEIACFTAPDGQRALIALTTGEIDKPDLIFLDINMPVMNGWKCLTRLKEMEEFKDIQVIVYSTSSYTEDVEKAMELGARWFFSKPLSFKAIEESMGLCAEHLYAGTLDALGNSSPLFRGYPVTEKE